MTQTVISSGPGTYMLIRMLNSHLNQHYRYLVAVQVYLKGGLPQFSRSAFLATLQGWLQRVGGTTDFQYLMLSAVFLPQQSLSLVGP